MTQGTPPTNKGTVGNWSSSTRSVSGRFIFSVPVVGFDCCLRLLPVGLAYKESPECTFLRNTYSTSCKSQRRS
jgi:hypothetical protein